MRLPSDCDSPLEGTGYEISVPRDSVRAEPISSQAGTMLHYTTIRRTSSKTGGSMSFLTSREQVAPQGIGKPVRRREDARLLTGGGHFADDMNLPGQAYAYMIRSPHAHARIASIDIGPAKGMPGSSRC